MGFGPSLFTDRRGRMSGRRAGCPGLQEWPDVRAGGADVRDGGEDFCDLWIDEAGFSGRGPDFRGFGGGQMSGARGRMSGPCSFSGWAAAAVVASLGVGCPGPVFTCIFGRLLLTPDHA